MNRHGYPESYQVPASSQSPSYTMSTTNMNSNNQNGREHINDAQSHVTAGNTATTPRSMLKSPTSQGSTYHVNPNHILDRFGFILNLDSDGNVLEDISQNEQLQKQLKLKNSERQLHGFDMQRTERRIKKWMSMVESWAPLETIRLKRQRKYRIVRRRARKGVPDSQRGFIWPVICGVEQKIRDNPGLYADLVHRSVIHPNVASAAIISTTSELGNDTAIVSPNTSSPTHANNLHLNHTKSFRSIQESIERDLHRTYPRHSLFVDESSNHGAAVGDIPEDDEENNSQIDNETNSSIDDDENFLNSNHERHNITDNNCLKDDDVYNNEAQQQATQNGLCGTTAADITNALRQQLDLASSSKKQVDSLKSSETLALLEGRDELHSNDNVNPPKKVPRASSSSPTTPSTTTPKGTKNLSNKKKDTSVNNNTSTQNNQTVSSAASAEGMVTPEVVLEGRGGQAAMRRVLKAYSTYDRQTGYCQGMNFIVGMFLTLMTEEQAFWMLVVIMFEKPCKMRGLFGEGMKETHKVLYIAEKLINQFLPKLAKHFENESIHITMFATQWLLTVYTSSFHFDLVTRVWDCFLVEGWKIIYRVMLSILQHYQNDLLKMPFEEILGFFRTLPDRLDGYIIIDEAMEIQLRWNHIMKYENEWHEQQQ